MYLDCSSPPAGDPGAGLSTDPSRCGWNQTLDLSAVTAVVDGSKLGGQLEVAVDGAVTWRSAAGDPELVCRAHQAGVRVFSIAGHLKLPHQDHVPFDYHGLLSNRSAVARAARGLASMAFEAGYDGVEFDMEAIGAPYGPERPGPARGLRLGPARGRRRLVFCIYLAFICIYLVLQKNGFRRTPSTSTLLFFS